MSASVESTPSPSVETNLTAAEVVWLERGGPFPEMVEVSSGLGTRRYRVADRGEDGRVEKIPAGRKGFVLRVIDPDTNLDFAVKFCAPGDYTPDRSPITEGRRAALLRDAGDRFAIPRVVGEAPAFDGQPDPKHGWICFVLDWIPGHTLKELIANPESELLAWPTFVVTVAKDIIHATLILRNKLLKHDDLQPSNIKIVKISPEILVGRPDAIPYRLVVIDTGSLKPIDQPSVKAHDDWTRVVATFVQLYNAMKRDRALVARYSEFMGGFKRLITQLADDEISRHFPQDADIFHALDSLLAPPAATPTAASRFDPFEGISAEHLASDQEILELFVRELPWIEEALSGSPTVVTGPRGCGKSMVFRYLAARTHLSSATADVHALDRIGMFGVYIPCASDLQNEVLWMGRDEATAESMRVPLATIFGLILARELMRTFALVEASPEASRHLGLTTDVLQGIVSFVREYFPHAPVHPRLRQTHIAEGFANELDQLRLDLGRRLLRNEAPPHKLPLTFVRDLGRYVVSRVLGLRQLPLVFLLDDYSHPRISRHVQKVLNPVIWARDPTIRFKVSCERWGFEYTNEQDIGIDENREFAKVDAGRLTARLHSKKRQAFVEKLMNARLKRAGYQGTIKQILGKSKFSHDSKLALHLREKRNDQNHYHGFEIFSNLLTGDIATLLHFGRSIFTTGHVTADQTTCVSPTEQHSAIVDVSRSLLGRISSFWPYGQEMHRIATHFGQIVEKTLKHGSLMKNGEPRRMPRLEMSRREVKDFYKAVSEVTGQPEVGEIARELVRRSIFVDLSDGVAKEGIDYHTHRWHMRAALLPAFNTALLKNHYFDVDNVKDFAELIRSPQEAFARLYDRYHVATLPDDLFDGESS